jgi:hypothetical protein
MLKLPGRGEGGTIEHDEGGNGGKHKGCAGGWWSKESEQKGGLRRGANAKTAGEGERRGTSKHGAGGANCSA